MKVTKASNNIFKDFNFTSFDSEKLHLKSQLMIKIEKFISSQNLTQEEAGELMGVSRTRISDLIRGKIDRFSIDMLINMLINAGFHFKVKDSNSIVDLQIERASAKK